MGAAQKGELSAIKMSRSSILVALAILALSVQCFADDYSADAIVDETAEENWLESLLQETSAKPSVAAAQQHLAHAKAIRDHVKHKLHHIAKQKAKHAAKKEDAKENG